MSDRQDLPNDIATCHALIQAQIELTERLARDNEKLKFELEQLKRYIHGQRSERFVDDGSQLPLFDTSVEDNGETASDDETVEEKITVRRRRKKSDRFPDNLPRETQVIDVPDQERACPCCGDEMPVIDKDVRERLEYVPAKMVVHVLEYLKRACSNCKETVKVAPPPESDNDAASLTKGSRYGFGVTSQIILGKYADHLPLYRLEDVFARAGVVIPRSTQVGLLDAAADLITPLTDLMKSRLLTSPVIGRDDTPVRLQDTSLPGKMRTGRMWLARSNVCGPEDPSPYSVFFFHRSRAQGKATREGPSAFLADYHGWATVDAYGVYDGVYLGSEDRIFASCCHAHVRRKFEAARSNDPQRAARALAFYRQLFDIEDEAAELSANDRLRLRREKSLPLVEQFRLLLEDWRADAGVLPKSAIGVAVRYALNQWKPLIAFLEDGRLPIHNNDTERELRKLTIGRKNWLFIGSEAAGEVAARMYTLVASASRQQLDLWAYLDDVLRSLAGGQCELESLLPDRWAVSHPESIRTYRQQESLARAAQTKARRARRRKLKSR
ncbi:IS66 family transposase [Novipirellula sp. SH528]|uniref:IS66 family transposase n=1 Tax=Novipirellula sp. SH528 TaxID=3454466 RepID=UPI003F9F9F48